MEAIKKYLNSTKKDFDKGMTLLRKFHKSRTLINNIDHRKLQGKLEYELKKISRWEPKKLAKSSLPPPPTDPPTDPPADEPKTGKDDGIPVVPSPETEKIGKDVISRAVSINLDLEALPEPLQARYRENTVMYKLCRSLHEKLKLMKDALPEEREPHCKELIKKDKKIRENWNAIDEHLKSTADPREDDPANRVVVDHKRINANRTYISKNKKKLIELKDSNPVKFADLKVKVQGRITELVNADQSFKDDLVVELKALGINFDGDAKAGPK